VKLKLDGETYSCLFDVGAPYSFISEDMFQKHKKALGLKLMKRSERNKSFDFKIDKAVRQIPAILAGTTIDLNNVIIRNRKRSSSKCFIGIDTIIKSGGLSLSLNSGQIKFGQRLN